MFAPYRRALAAPGALAFTLSGLLARLAFTMNGVAVLVLVADRRGSYALAGAVCAAGVVAAAAGMPLLGRLVDRYGQARVTVPAVLARIAPVLALAACARGGAPDWTLFVCWAAAATTPNLGGMARARWAHLHRADETARHRANALEQALDELCFMAGPVLAMLLSTALTPEVALLAANGLGTVGALLFAARRDTEPPVGPPATGTTAPLRSAGLRVLVLTFLATGVLFGSLEVTTVAYTDALGHRPVAGVLLALVAAGSCLSGLLYGLRPARRSPAARFLAGVAAMAVLLLLPPAAVHAGAGLPGLAVALLAAGCGTAPTMVSGMTLIQELLPPRQLNEGMALAVSGILAGISAGAALGGAIAERAGPGAGYLVPAAAALLALLTATAGRRRLARPVRPVHLVPPARPTADGAAPADQPRRAVGAAR
ncbi:MFS transporter [Kitasatospora sp. NPDC049258]|uniref:MFS transporter n=1 Tax=Kitasatospora sp. NPDC049258 TaxID=3155394 RepID=UPI00342CBE2F